eukprot:m.27784 g.27784  ORF g.27784 m.27784 type:complete len:127 (+) comp4831_c0_seq1:1111-1491(+)
MFVSSAFKAAAGFAVEGANITFPVPLPAAVQQCARTPGTTLTAVVHIAGGTYVYPFYSAIAAGTRVSFRAQVSGVRWIDESGGNNANFFRPGTVSFQVGFLANHKSPGACSALQDFSVRRVLAAPN